MAFKLLPEKQGKYDKRVNSFTATCTDIKIQEGFGDDYKLVLEFGDEPVLSVNLNYSKWIATEEGMTPKAGSSIHKLLASMMKLGVEFSVFDVENYEIATTPSLLGKELTFDVQSGMFPLPDTGDIKTFYVWTLKKIGGQPAPKAPAQPEQKEVAPADMAVVKKGWLQTIDSLNAKFTFPQMLSAKAKFLQNAVLGAEEKEYFTAAKKVKEMFASMLDEGFVTQKGSEYIKNEDAILAGMMA